MKLPEFENYLKKKNLSKNTIIAYLSSARLFFSVERAVSVKSLRRYRAFLISRYKPSTVNLRIHGINRYVRFLLAADGEGAWPELTDFQLRSVKLSQKSFSDSVISDKDYRKLKHRLKKDGRMLWYFVVRFLGATGARVSELIQIKVEHLSLGYLDLYSKGGKLRRIYFPDILCQEALSWCAEQDRMSGFLFLNQRGVRISDRGIRCQLKHYARQYGIDENTVYPHSFRHLFAINFLKKYNDITLLADLMGHENIETTRIYLVKSSREQQKLLDKLITW